MKKYPFTKAMRLAKRREFQAVYEEGVRVRGATLMLVARPNGLAQPRLGIAAAKAKMKLSPDRNRFKRLVREAFRLGREKLPNGVDLVVAPLRGGLKFTLEGLQEELTRLAEQARKRMK